ncbi:MAG TPA: carboxypeptidase regulatory-like domain-containing protein [Tepidisphaeraceae bacterium]|nr:carboxypeptidase regulatory-like domain-containing protein [Tepidisphaeraceae bacterium]
MLLSFGLATLIGGCGESTSSQSESAASALPKVAAGTATVRGAVKFTGTPPVMKEIANQPCHGTAKPMKEESVVLNDNGTLANVIVSLSGVSADPLPRSTPPALDQVGCQYVPHVVAVQAGQPLTVRSSDPTIHNVHFTPSKNKSRNLNMPGPDEQQVTFEHPEFVRFKCDIHPWMNAYVGVFPHPFFHVTGNDGSFELTNLPVGTYTLTAWHERYGELQETITITDGTPTPEVTFTYAP